MSFKAGDEVYTTVTVTTQTAHAPEGTHGWVLRVIDDEYPIRVSLDNGIDDLGFKPEELALHNVRDAVLDSLGAVIAELNDEVATLRRRLAAIATATGQVEMRELLDALAASERAMLAEAAGVTLEEVKRLGY